MTWSVDTSVTIANLISTIATRLTASGWTLTDRAADQVWHSTNNHGVTQYIQITNCQNSGAAADSTHNRYLQLQGWKSWDVGTHAGANGSGTTQFRIYYSAADVADTVQVDLYMSVNANRFIAVVLAPSGYRSWGYFGGLDSLAGTSNPTIVYIAASHSIMNGNCGGALLSVVDSANFWNYQSLQTLLPARMNSPTGWEGALIVSVNPVQGLTGILGEVLFWPIILTDTLIIYGGLDGMMYCPIGYGAVGHLDTAVLDGITYMIIVPGGLGVATNYHNHPFTGGYTNALAIAEV